MNKELQKKISLEIHRILWDGAGEVPCTACFIQGYNRGAESPAMLDFIVRRAVELAREGIGTESLYNDYDHTIEAILLIIKKEIEG